MSAERSADPSSAATAAPVVPERLPLKRLREDWPGMRTRYILDPGGDSWEHFAISEWELERAGWTDAHPHDEINIVIDGELHVETNGETVVLHAGDTVTVTAGSTGSYWAPRHARMIGIYGPNPDGAVSDYIRYWDIDAPAAENAESGHRSE